MVYSHTGFQGVSLRSAGSGELGRVYSPQWIIGQCLGSSHNLIYLHFLDGDNVSISEVWWNYLVMPYLADMFIKSACFSYQS